MSAWPVVKQWIDSSSRDIATLPPERGTETLVALGVTAESTLGAIVLNTGGILVDRGWIRLIGGGSERMLSVSEWASVAASVSPTVGDGPIVAYGAIGGFYLADATKRTVLAFMPDQLDWLDTDLGYSDFVHWTMHGDVTGFYGGLRWKGWEEDTAMLAPDRGLLLYPPPFTTEGKNAGSSARGNVPVTELWDLYPGGGLLQESGA